MHLFDFAETFVAVVDDESFAKAARKLKIAPSVVTRRINLLEEKLGVQLIVRTTRKLSVTHAGEQFYQQMQQIINDWQEACTSVQARQQRPSGRLVVMIAVPLSRLLHDAILGFIRLYPDIQLECYQAQTRADIVVDAVDIVLGPTHLLHDTDGVVGRFIGASVPQLYASPNYLKKHGVPKKLSDLKKHRHILWKRRDEQKTTWEFVQDKVDCEPSYILNDWELALKFALEGEGVIMLPKSICINEIKSGQLSVILPEYHAAPVDLYIFYAKRRFLPLTIRLFVDHIMNAEIIDFYESLTHLA